MKGHYSIGKDKGAGWWSNFVDCGRRGVLSSSKFAICEFVRSSRLALPGLAFEKNFNLNTEAVHHQESTGFTLSSRVFTIHRETFAPEYLWLTGFIWHMWSKYIKLLLHLPKISSWRKPWYSIAFGSIISFFWFKPLWRYSLVYFQPYITFLYSNYSKWGRDINF